jgi:catechol 2,3-dioxygenase-like lactoylglutathione lyase family enzyme
MVTGLQHVLVLSDDIDSTRDFYRDVVGMSVGPRPPLEFPGYWLYAGAVPCLHIADRTAYRAHAGMLGLPVAPAGSADGPIDHVAFASTGYDEALAALAQRGLSAVPNTVPGVQRQLFIDDPNGVRVELNFPI